MSLQRDESNDATVVSSFYSTPDGSNTVRFYEITNGSQNKLHKNSLDELRIENFSNDAFENFKSFFRGKKSTVNSNNSEHLNNPEKVIDDNSDLKTAKTITHHTRHDGGLLTVTAFDLTKKKGSDLAMQDFLRRQAILKQEVERAKIESQSNNRRQELTESWLETSTYSRGSHQRNSVVNKNRNKSVDRGKKSRKRDYTSKYERSRLNEYDDDDEEYYDPYIGSPRSYRRGHIPLPCNCIECQAKLRSGMVGIPCDCFDCRRQQQSMPFYQNGQQSSYH